MGIKQQFKANTAQRERQSALVKKLIMMGKIAEASELAYKLTSTNFQGKNLALGAGLDGTGKFLTALEFVISISDAEFDELALEVAKLGISLSRRGTGVALVEMSYDALKLIGENARPEYASQMMMMSNHYNALFIRSKGNTEYFDKAVKYEREAIRVVKQMYTRP